MINERQARRYCKEDLSKIKNYDKAIADTTQTWDCHHMTETWWGCTKKDLIENECYYHRKACELIFLTKAEHNRLHSMNMSDETRRKMSESHKEQTVTDETRRKLSESLKGRTFSEESRRKLSEAAKHRSPISDETRRKLSEARKRYYAKKRGEI